MENHNETDAVPASEALHFRLPGTHRQSWKSAA